MIPPAPNPDEFPRELLAAYADGELDPATRAAVEQWLADHPDALDEVQTQRALSPANAPLWDRAEPPEPSSRQWAAVRGAIENQLIPSVPPRGRWQNAAWTLAALATAGVAAAVAWVAFGPAAHPPRKGDTKGPEFAEAVRGPELAPAPREVAAVAPAPHSADPLDAFAVLPIATDIDVVLERVPEFHAGWLPIGQHPVPGLLSLATQEEILLAEVAPSAAWPTGGPKMTNAPGDAPMIFAPKTR